MTDANAAGRKTETKFEEALAEQMALCRNAVADCFGEAAKWSRRFDQVTCDQVLEYRGQEFGFATGLINACAALTLAAGKLKGEFDHRIRVTREAPAAAGDPLPETGGSIPQ